MDYNALDVDKIVDEVVNAVEHGNYRKATNKESMAVRLAALSAIVHEMQEIVEHDRELVNA